MTLESRSTEHCRAAPVQTCPRRRLRPDLLVSWLFTSCSRFYFLFHDTHCTRKVIGGELQERLIPVPYSKTSTDQAVRFDTYMPEPAVSLTRLLSNFLCWPFLFFLYVQLLILYYLSTYNFVRSLYYCPIGLYSCADRLVLFYIRSASNEVQKLKSLVFKWRTNIEVSIFLH